MLVKSAAAVQKMKALPEGDPRNRVFRWYSRWFKGEAGRTSAQEKRAEIARDYGAGASPQKALGGEM